MSSSASMPAITGRDGNEAKQARARAGFGEITEGRRGILDIWIGRVVGRI